MKRFVLPALLCAAAGCKVGPDYERPEADVPAAFRGAEVAPAMPELSFGDLAWFELFDDPVLQELIGDALQGNRDLRVAAERVVEASALLQVTRGELYPQLDAAAAYERQRISENGALIVPPGFDPEREQFTLLGGLAWELDLFGRIQRATEAARAELFATEHARHAVVQALVAELALAYFELLALDAELDVARATLASRERSRELVALRLEQGVASALDLRQAEGLVLQAASLIPDLERRVEQRENAIRFLLGTNPGPVPRGRPLAEQPRRVEIPPGLPSQLLERRPDVRFAEEQLVAANARIGAAKALLYPRIGLSAGGGVASSELSSLFEGDSVTWNVTPFLSLPLFTGGRLSGNVAASEARQRQALERYLQTLEQAFRETSDALVQNAKVHEVYEQRRRLEATLADQADLSRERYRGGVTSYLEVLDSERDHFDAQLALVRSIRDELFATVLLYRALGGGWQEAETRAAGGEGSPPAADSREGS